ncbi:MAG: hypothetical protein SV422_07875 [Pseudomonadota bacterium]|nr:hypothetical protein [Pseudomonadota bacterium]
MNNYWTKEATTQDELDWVCRFRYEAFERVGDLVTNDERLLRDNYDHAPNVTSYLLHHDATPEPIGTIRTAVHSASFGWLPTPGAQTYADAIREHLGAGTSYVESSRFAMAEIGARSLMKAHLYIFRMLAANAIKHRCEWIITAVSPKFVSYYQKTMNFKQLSDERELPGFTLGKILIGSEFNAATLDFCRRVNPYFDDLVEELSAQSNAAATSA